MNKGSLPGLLIPFVLCGCAERGTPVGVSDSAGVELVRMSAAFASTVPELSPRENLRIGAVDGPPQYQLFRVLALAEADDGTIFVLDAGNHVVRAFDSSGEFLHEFGSEGQGPGTFETDNPAGQDKLKELGWVGIPLLAVFGPGTGYDSPILYDSYTAGVVRGAVVRAMGVIEP